MKNPELFHKTIGILVNAYLNDTLRHSNCYACAVGNLVAGNLGLKYRYHPVVKNLCWVGVEKYTPGNTWYALIAEAFLVKSGINKDEANYQISITGYSFDEIKLIEQSFESADESFNNDEDGYNGLMSVCDTLMQIHEANPEEIKEAKLLFVK